MSISGAPRTLFDKLWDAHVVAEVAPGVSMLYVDRHFIHDLGGNDALMEIDVAPLSREALLEGLDPIAMTLRREPEIAAFEDRDLALRPWLHERG